MAIELTRARIRAIIANGAVPLAIPPYVVGGIAAVVVAMVLTSLLIGIRDAHRDHEVAQQQFADAQALLQAPPINTSVLQTKLEGANADLAIESALAAPPSVDPSSDQAAALLVRRSESAGLSVKGISRTASATAKLKNGSFNVEGIRLSVEGAVSQVLALLADLHKVEPSFIPVLGGLAISEAGVAHAEIGFDTYTAMATPTAVAPVKRKAAP